MNIRVAIADDHPLVISGIQKMLAGHDHISLTGAYSTAQDLLQGMEEDTPDILLLDIQLPEKTGNKLAPVLLKKYPDLRILTLTNFDSIFYVRQMLHCGALGYLLKSTDQQTLMEAIATVYEYKEFIEPSLKEQLDNRSFKKNRMDVEQPVLSNREKEVIQLIADGFTTQEIADKLYIGFTTAENYRQNLLTKLGVKNTATLIKKAVQLGLVQ